MPTNEGSVSKFESVEVDGRKVKYASHWIMDLERRDHFVFYWEQANLVYSHVQRDQAIIELGCGSYFLADLLTRRGFSVKTLDIDPAKNPDYVSDASTFDYSCENFEVLLAFEVFEHIPWETFVKVVERVAESQINQVIFSVPWGQRTLLHMQVKAPRVPQLRASIKLPRKSIPTPAHFWELSRREKESVSEGKQFKVIADVAEVFDNAGFRLETKGREQYIQFFVATRR